MWETLDRIDSPEDFIYDPYLVLCLPLYMLDGASFMSREAYGHLCTVTGALWRPDGRYFDGIDDYVDCGNNASLNITDAITLEAWVKLNNLTALRNIVGKFGASGNRAHALYFDKSSSEYCLYIVGADLSIKVAYSPNATLGVWQHVVGTYNKSQLIAYLNGVAGTPVSYTQPIALTTVEEWIGNVVGSNYPFNGVIDEVRIYNRALNALEIQYNYLITEPRRD